MGTERRVLYRVFPWHPEARVGAPGHPTFVPPQGAGRADNPDHYAALYASDSPAGAVAEAFGNFRIWTDALFGPHPRLPDSRRAIAVLELSRGRVLDLDDAKALLARELRPSHVVVRDRDVTQAWALRVFREGRWAGLRWWSRHDARWGSHAVWQLDRLRVAGVEPLSWSHPAVASALDALAPITGSATP